MALPFAKWLQVRGIGRHTVIVNILGVRHIGDLGVAANAERAARALIDVVHLDLLAGKVWLAEAIGKQFLWNAAVLLADFHIESLRLAVNHAGLGQRLVRRQCQ